MKRLFVGILGVCLGACTSGAMAVSPESSAGITEAVTTADMKVSKLQPFSDTDFTAQREHIKTFLQQVNEATTRNNIEEIFKTTLAVENIGMQAGNGMLQDNYGHAFLYINYSYAIRYTKRYGNSTSLLSMDIAFPKYEENSDDDRCLSVSEIRSFALAGGWHDEEPFAEWMSHGFRATKGRLRLEVSSFGGTGERVLSQEDMREWISNLAYKGCVFEIRVFEIL